MAATAALLPSPRPALRVALLLLMSPPGSPSPLVPPHELAPTPVHVPIASTSPSVSLSLGLGPQPTPPAGPAHASPPRANPASSPAQSSPAFTHCVCGSRQRLESIVSHPDLPLSRSHVLSNLLASMDSHDTIRFSRHYPNSVGTVQGGRAIFRDYRGKGNTLLTCHANTRAYIFGPFHDEIDISRSHLTHCVGSYALTRRPRPISMLRYLSEQQALEDDIEAELRRVRPQLLARPREGSGWRQ